MDPASIRPDGSSMATWLARARERTFTVMVVWLAFVFLLGGSSRADVSFLAVLRPVSVLLLVYAVATCTWERIVRYRVLVALAVAAVVLPALQLVPLPADVWRALPDRGIIAEIDRAAGLGEIWRPLSMAPDATRNALWSLAAPLATLFLGIQLSEGQRVRLLAPVLLLAAASGLLGLLQILGDASGPLNYYKYTSTGFPNGFFANRNHQAAFLACMLPVLAVWTRSRAARPAGGARSGWRGLAPLIVGGVAIIPLVLITGSRSGMVLTLMAAIAVPLILLKPSSEAGRKAGWRWLLLPTLALAAAASIYFGRGVAIDRLMGANIADDMRVLILPTVLDMVRTYMPWGAGFGSFEDVYRLHETRELLRPFYMNHAHNDWLELALNGGIPAIAVAAVSVGILAVRGARVVLANGGDRGSLARLGLMILVILALASMTDYPLRVPSLACLAVLAVLWLCTGAGGRRVANGDET